MSKLSRRTVIKVIGASPVLSLLPSLSFANKNQGKIVKFKWDSIDTGRWPSKTTQLSNTREIGPDGIPDNLGFFFLENLEMTYAALGYYRRFRGYCTITHCVDEITTIEMEVEPSHYVELTDTGESFVHLADKFSSMMTISNRYFKEKRLDVMLTLIRILMDDLFKKSWKSTYAFGTVENINFKLEA